MNIKARPEKGQALILIALAAIGLFGFAALAIDGSRAYSDKRNAQNAADTAALAAALEYTRGYPEYVKSAEDRAISNGYDNGERSDVTITVADIAKGSGICPGNAAGKEFTVTIVSYVDTTFARVLGRDQVTNAVTATTRGCEPIIASLFDGHAIVGLKPAPPAGELCNTHENPASFDSGNSNSAKWKVEGSGLFSNGCAYAKDGTPPDESVTLDPGKCMTTVAGSSGFTCSQQTTNAIDYPEDVWEIMPPNPCDGTPGDIGLPPPATGSTFENGVYCISDLDKYDKKDIVLNNATLYVTDLKFDLNFSGGGGFSGTATQGGDFDDYYIVVAFNPNNPCTSFSSHDTQVLEWRGNGGGTFYGTILAPSACVDIRGNGDPSGLHTQIIGYLVSSNGDAGIYIKYDPEENHKYPVDPNISLLK